MPVEIREFTPAPMPKPMSLTEGGGPPNKKTGIGVEDGGGGNGERKPPIAWGTREDSDTVEPLTLREYIGALMPMVGEDPYDVQLYKGMKRLGRWVITKIFHNSTPGVEIH